MSFKKKIFTGVMLSTVTLSTLAPITALTKPVTVHANTTDDKIAAAEATIANAQASSAEAQAALNTLQTSVDAANAKVTDLTNQMTATTAQINSLKATIDQRDTNLKAQARSAQTDGGAASYINTILNAKSLTDVVQKVTAMSQVVSANNAMMQQQKNDEATLEAKLADNSKAYDETTKLQQQLVVQQHDLNAANLQYQATIATAQDQKDQLEAQKQAEIAAAQAYAASQAAMQQQAAAAASSLAAQQQAAAQQQVAAQQNTGTPAATSRTAASTTTAVSASTFAASVSSSSSASGNPYPYGQCTWGVYEILGGHMPIYKGNAGDWAVNANTSTPAPGEIIVFPGGVGGASGYGHVAVIMSVNADGTVNIEEANYNGQPYVTSRSNVSTAGTYFIIP